MVFGKLFASKRNAPASSPVHTPQMQTGLRVYAIGDIHGRLDLLEDLEAQIARDCRTGTALQSLVIYLGDYVDRGLQSREVIDRLLEGPPAGTRAIHLKGNHEEAVLDFLQDPSFGMMWRNFGGLETLYSYGVPNAISLSAIDEFIVAREAFSTALPRAHLAFLKGLKVSVTFGDYLFVHAGVRPGVPLTSQLEEDMLWIRDLFLDSDADFGKVVVHGHTPEEHPIVKHNRIGVDTGAYMTGVLTAVVIEGASVRFLEARA